MADRYGPICPGNHETDASKGVGMRVGIKRRLFVVFAGPGGGGRGVWGLGRGRPGPASGGQVELYEGLIVMQGGR